MSKSPARDFGVQSYCFRHFKDNAQVAELTKKIGVKKIELCAVHADFDDVDAFKRVLDIYRKAGVEVVSIGVQTFVGDTSRERKWFQCVQAAGARHISAHFTVGTFQSAVPAVAKLCDEFKVRIGLHCHGGYMFGGSPDVLDFLLKLGGPNFGLNLDTAWCMQIGPNGNPIQWVRERFKSRIYGVHYKDFVFDRRGQWSDVIVGTGNLDLPEFVKALEETDFDGMAVIEYEADVENPVPALTKCVAKMRELAK
ncbi:MAG TPA: sugar phosphate isomerase/epimerase [Tepidisphaeraceae bacterium]|jgi:sugar phosphate isomerase/epimerase|nr:sugar phosphate isomerase/epimerase [Tepidisphaeraceae bacterium]